MLHLAGLLDELERSEPARAAMAILESALARRSVEEQTAFWRAVDLYYVSRWHREALGEIGRAHV